MRRRRLEVASGARCPFVVRVDGHVVRDLGTVFDVAHVDGGVGVTVAEGLVEVSSDEKRAVLSPDQAIRLAAGGLGKVRRVDDAASIAWTRGRLMLENRTLDEILSTLTPHYGGRIVILNGTEGKRRLSVVSTWTMSMNGSPASENKITTAPSSP